MHRALAWVVAAVIALDEARHAAGLSSRQRVRVAPAATDTPTMTDETTVPRFDWTDLQGGAIVVVDGQLYEVLSFDPKNGLQALRIGTGPVDQEIEVTLRVGTLAAWGYRLIRPADPRAAAA